MSGYLNELIRDNEDVKEAVRNVEKTSKTAKVNSSLDMCIFMFWSPCCL